MKRYQTIILVILLILATTTAVTAANGPAILRQRFVAIGMQPKSSGALTLRGTFGEPFAGDVSSGQMHVCTGIWCGWPFLYEVRVPVVLRK